MATPQELEQARTAARGQRAAIQATNIRQEQANAFQHPEGQGPATTIPEQASQRGSANPYPFAAVRESGTDIKRGLPAFERLQLSFAGSDAVKFAHIKYNLGHPVRRGVEGDIEYFDNTDENRGWHLVDEAGISLGDFADAAGIVLPTVGAIAGFLYVGGSTGGTGGTWGAAGGTYLGEWANVGIGQMLGLDQFAGDTDWWGLSKGPNIAAGIELAMGATGTVGAKIYRTGRQIIHPIGMDLDSARKAMLDVSDEDIQLIRYIEETTGKRFIPPTGQMTNDEYLMAVTQQLRTDVEQSVALSRQLNENESTLEAYFRSISEFKDANPDAYKRIVEVQNALKESAESAVDQGTGVVAGRVAQAQNELRYLDEGYNPGDSSRMAHEVVMEQHENAVMAERVLWDEAQRAYGLDATTSLSTIKVPISDDFRRYYARVKANTELANFGGQRSANGQLLSDVFEEAMYSGNVANQTLDLHQLGESIKYWRRVVRTKAGRGDASTTEINAMIKQMVDLRTTHLSNTPGHRNVLELIEHAEGASKVRAQDFDNSIVGAMFKTDAAGNYTIADQQMFAMLMANKDPTAFRHFMTLVDDDPAAKQAVMDGFNAFYKSEVVDPNTMLPDAAKHALFIREAELGGYGDQMDAIFGADAVSMRALGRFEGPIVRARARLEALKKGITSSWRGKLANTTNPKMIAATVFGGGRGGLSRYDVEDMMQVLDRAGQSENFKRATIDWITERIYKPDSKTKLNLINLGKILDGTYSTDVAGKLEMVMGPAYMADLRRLHQGLSIVRRTPRNNVVEPKNTNMLNFMRAFITPPLSQRGRFQSAAVEMRYTAATRALGDVLRDPAKLKELVRMDRFGASKDRMIKFFSSVGGAWMGHEIAQAWADPEYAAQLLGETPE